MNRSFIAGYVRAYLVVCPLAAGVFGWLAWHQHPLAWVLVASNIVAWGVALKMTRERWWTP